MTTRDDDTRIATGVRNLDEMFGGGLPRGSATLIAGSPGAGKTILSQQICFHNASAERPALYFSTLSEPTAKTLRYLQPFSFFDAGKLGTSVQFADLGALIRAEGLAETSKVIMEKLKEVKPGVVVIDSFKAFDDLAKSKEDLRKFGYELAVNLMAWEATTFLLGEYGEQDVQTNPLFSIVDGLIMVSQREQSGEQQRFIQIRKMRGVDHSRDEHAFLIGRDGVEVFAPRVTIRRKDRGPTKDRCKTHVAKLDDLLGAGIPRGSSLLVAGVAGTGKTVLLLEFVYRGALAGEKGIIFSFEETEERLRAAARGLGWSLDQEIERGMIEIVFIPQPDIMVERDLLMMHERIETGRARRVAVDSVSVFLHKVRDPQLAREKVFQLATIVQNAQAVSFLATDIPYGSLQLSRFGVEETVVDGVILLSSTEEGLERRRYLEVYKLRNTAHLKGRHSMGIGRDGLTIFPRYNPADDDKAPPPAVATNRRVSSGVAGLDALLGGGLLERSVTLVSGSAGSGKTTFGLQFLVEGAARKESGLYVSLEESPPQILAASAELGLPLGAAVDDGTVELVYLPRDEIRSNRFLAILEDRVRAKKTRRVVLDGVSLLAADGQLPRELRELLFSLVTRFKSLGVTSLLTFEASMMYANGSVSDHGFSPIADNIVCLRYVRVTGEDRPSIAILKTRGGVHDRATYFVSIKKGGLHVRDRVDPGRSLNKNDAGAKKRSRR